MSLPDRTSYLPLTTSLPYAELLQPYLQHRMDLGASFYFVYHYQKDCCVYVESRVQAVLQYPASTLLNHSSDFLYSRMHPDDQAQHQKLMRYWRSFYASLPLPERHRYSTSLDYRLQKKNGVYVRILQQLIRVEYDQEGNELYCLGKCTNISHWQKDTNMVLSIIGPGGQEKLVSQLYRTDNQTSTVNFTRAQMSVLRLMAQGLTSWEIAQELNVAESTVSTHRRNMHRKANTHSASALITFCREQGMLGD